MSQQSPSQFQAEGELIILGLDHLKNFWHLGKVTKVIPSRDGVIRKVEVLTKGTIVRRTINKLITLELHCENEIETELVEDDFLEESSVISDSNSNITPPTLSEDESPPSARPKRRAAEAARSLVKKLVKKDLL